MFFSDAMQVTRVNLLQGRCEHEEKAILQTFWMKISFSVIRENVCLQRHFVIKGEIDQIN